MSYKVDIPDEPNTPILYTEEGVALYRLHPDQWQNCSNNDIHDWLDVLNTYQEVFEESPEIMLHDKITGADVYRLPPHSLIAQDNEGAVIVGENYVFYSSKGLTKEEFAQSFHNTEFTVLRLGGTVEA